jgi:hypothetical protein
MEESQEQKGIRCHFAATAGGLSPGTKCEGEAASFVRVKHSGRLCPLCGVCRESFVQAQSRMSEESRKAMVGEASYEDVALEAGAEEYARQPPRK